MIMNLPDDYRYLYVQIHRWSLESLHPVDHIGLESVPAWKGYAALKWRRQSTTDSDRPTPELTVTIGPKAIQTSQTQIQRLLKEVISLSM